MTSLSDPETCLITHSLTERDKTEDEVGNGGKRSREEKSKWEKWSAPAGILNRIRPRHTPTPNSDHWLTLIPAGRGRELRVSTHVWQCQTKLYLSAFYIQQILTELVSHKRLFVCNSAKAVSNMSVSLFHTRVYFPESRLNVSVYC